MNFRINNKLGLLALALVYGLLLSACAGTEPKASSVQERATARWEAILSGDLGGAYEYLSPGYRSSVTSMQYQRAILLKRVQWTGAEYRESECTESVCDVRFLLQYRLAGALPGVGVFNGQMDIHESWIKVAGMWYVVPE